MTSRSQRRIKIAVSVALVAGLLYFLDTESLASIVKEINGWYVLLALAMIVGNRLLMPFKWNLLLRARGIRLSHFDAVRIYTISAFLGLFLPPTLGADSIRSYYVRRTGIRLSDVVASIVVERVLGLVVLLLATVAGFLLLMYLLRDGDMQAGVFAGALAIFSTFLIAALYVSFTPKFQQIASSLAERLRGTRLDKLAVGADSFVRAYQEHRYQKRALVVFCGLTVVELTLAIVRSYVVALSLGVDLPAYVYFAFLPLVALLNRLPISFDGFGITEGLFTYFLGLFGVVHERGFLIGLINHLLFIVCVLPGGLFYVFSDRYKDYSAPTT